VRRLMRAFVEWQYGRHHDYRELIKNYFDPVRFDLELVMLPGKFAPPAGRLLLAAEGGAEAGCIALQDLADQYACTFGDA
jgi:hypothetical protein